MSKKWTRMAVIGIMLLLGAGSFWVFSAGPADDLAYFPLETGNQWAYQSIYFDNTKFREDLLVDKPDNGILRLMIFNNGDPVAEIQFRREKEGLLKTKEISGAGVVNYEPAQLSLASKLKPGVSWKWKSADGKGSYIAKVQKGGQVTVPAGTFDTILIRTDGVSEAGEKFTDETWYAKGTGYVKSVVTIGGKKKIDELVEYKVGKKVVKP